MPEESVHRGLTRLQASEFLYETSVFPDLEYTFKHALTHEVTYASVLQDRRCALHARIVEAIETLYSDRLHEQVERLAHHAFRGELWETALTYLRHAGDKALTRSDPQELGFTTRSASSSWARRISSRTNSMMPATVPIVP